MPFFSIIIPTYNRSDLIVKTLKTVQNQSFNDWECIIIDDGSTDNTKFIVEEKIREDSRFKYYYQSNSERCEARNNGIKFSSGKYICFLDSDDQFIDNHLFELNNYIIKNTFPTAMIFTNYSILNNNSLREIEIPKLNNNLLSYLAYNPIIPSRVCIHKEILNQLNFEKDILNGEDTLLWFRIALKFPILHLPISSVIYIIHENNSVNIKNNGALIRLNGFKIFFKRYPEVKMKIPKSILNFLLGDTHFTIAKFHIFKNNKFTAIKHIFISIFYQRFHNQLKHKTYVVLCLLINKKINEYSNG